MNKRIRSNIFFAILISIYTIIVVCIFVFLINLNRINEDKELKNYNSIYNKVNDILIKEDNLVIKLNDLIKENAIELVVIDNHNKNVVSTISYQNINQLKSSINSNITFKRVMYRIKSNSNNEYFVWLNVYQLPIKNHYNQLTIILSIIIILLITNLLIIIVNLLFKIVNPLRILDDNITQLNDFRFSMLTKQKDLDDYSRLSNRLVEFANKLNKSIQLAENKYLLISNQLINNELDVDIKTNMIKALIHDLKSPIAIIKLRISQAIKNKDLNLIKDQINELDFINDEINRIMIIINNMDIELVKESFNISNYINELIMEYFPLLDEREIMFEYIMDDDIYYYGNKEIIKQIFKNLMSNAIKYVNEKKDIKVRLKKENNEIIITIINSSNVISDEKQNDVFKIFTRFDEDIEGSGSGLYLARNLVQYIKGQISFKYNDGYVYVSVKIKEEDLDS